MNSPKDIVGIVKELQETMQPLEVRMHFPAIAQALLIAIDALQKISLETDDQQAENDAVTALSRIRSIPS